MIVYQICDMANPAVCDTATVTVPVHAPVIDAINDTGASVTSLNGGTSFANVLVNDKLNGVLVIPAQVTTSFVSSTNAGVTLSGVKVVVAPGTPAGNYSLVYKICEILNPTNCDTATVTVPVSQALAALPCSAPKVNFTNPSSIAYAVGTGIMNVNATPTSVAFTGGTVAVSSGSLTIKVKLTTAGGVAVPGYVGTDFVLTGTATDPGTMVTYSGTLLTGESRSFAYRDGGLAAGAADVYQFRFIVTGGSMVGLFPGDIGVSVTSDNGNTFTNTFLSNFAGNAKGNICSTPVP